MSIASLVHIPTTTTIVTYYLLIDNDFYLIEIILHIISILIIIISQDYSIDNLISKILRYIYKEVYYIEIFFGNSSWGLESKHSMKERFDFVLE